MKVISKRPESLKRATAAAATAAREGIRMARFEAFKAETDPLIGPVLRGEVSMDEYKAKVAEIRARHPYEKEA